MGKPGKHADAVWDAAFEREKAGERRRDLAVELGVSISTMNWQAKKRGLKRGVTPGWVDHRKRPEGGWPADHVFAQSRSGMTPGRWGGLLTRYVAGEPIEALAVEHGVAEATISRQATARGMRKMDRPEAVWRPRGPAAAAAGSGAASAGRAGLAFDYDPDDPEANAAALTALETAAAREGRASDFLTLRRMRRAAGLKPPPKALSPGAGFRLDWNDPEGTCVEILNAMLRAMEAGRQADVRQLERILEEVERTFRGMGQRRGR
ncbi:hypothetical protein [Brevundimonas sp. LjRoot202]|uniref:hypothetical protein n=1 Tax=Brevundimonas sp. LjRoot202 TaxID=3342281 RepID=UPI003ECEBD0C